jgi:outer membrane receptor for ferrienterochelin and colicin
VTTAAGSEDTTKVYFLDEITVSATRYVRDLFGVSRSVSVASSAEIHRENQVSILDVLDDRIGIWVEKRTGTTSDPVVRGLSGGNVLAIVDGGSVTTFWGEGGFAGDDMYGKIDSESIERIEVLRGPSSVLYGSNALGGVINFVTKRVPIDYAPSGPTLGCGGWSSGVHSDASATSLVCRCAGWMISESVEMAVRSSRQAARMRTSISTLISR